MADYKILVINPGSTSTKIAVYYNETELFDKTIRHSTEEMQQFKTIPDQKEFRYNEIVKALAENNIKLEDINAVAARGGIIKPIASGTYKINEAMVKDLNSGKAALHASALAGLIGDELNQKYGIPAYIVDPVVVDELQDVARITGIKGVERTTTFHALNQKAIAKEAAKDLGKPYEDCNLIVAHMGGGITVGAHHNGLVIDVNNGIEGEGSFSPERIGDTAPLTIARLMSEEGYTYQDIKNLCTKTGGLTSHLNTNDGRVAEEMAAKGDAYAKLVLEAMSYQVAKLIGAMSTVLKGKVDAIILTGGLAYSDMITSAIEENVSFIAPVKRYPGEFEIQALVQGVYGVLTEQITPKEYK